MESEILHIECGGDKKYDVSIKFRNVSKFIDNLLQDSNDPIVPLHEIEGEVFDKIKEYLEVH